MTMGSPDTIRISPERPVLIYDRSCDFCRRYVSRRQDEAGDRIAFVPSTEAERLLPAVGRLPLNESVHLIEPSGRISRGARAVFRMRAIAAGRSLPLWLYDNVPGFGYLMEHIYRLVARRRKYLGKSRTGEA